MTIGQEVEKPRRRCKEDFGIVWKMLTVACVISALWLVIVFNVICQYVDAYNQGFFDGYDMGTNATNEIVAESKVASYMPMHLQIDPQWSDTSYSTGTIKSHGCGLCCLSMMISYLKGKETYPTDLVMYQDNFLQAEVNDQDAMCKWASGVYGFKWSGEQWGFDEHIDEMLDAGYVVMCGMKGKLGDSEYGGHVVLIYDRVDDGYLIRDPDSASNSIHVFTKEELSEVTWGSLNGLKV
jgi:competence protein ComGC|nr:MAG TPA: Phytochelatin synthase [Caudoviricetes sp.]